MVNVGKYIPDMDPIGVWGIAEFSQEFQENLGPVGELPEFTQIKRGVLMILQSLLRWTLGKIVILRY